MQIFNQNQVPHNMKHNHGQGDHIHLHDVPLNCQELGYQRDDEVEKGDQEYHPHVRHSDLQIVHEEVVTVAGVGSRHVHVRDGDVSVRGYLVHHDVADVG